MKPQKVSSTYFNGTQTLVIVRGLPGSGKSTAASHIAEENHYIHVEADQFFTTVDGEYLYNKMRQRDAHVWCQAEVRRWLFHKRGVVVANTFTTMKEILPYFEISLEYGVPIKIIDCVGDFGSIHDVPEMVVDFMRDRWENVSIEYVNDGFSLNKYKVVCQKDTE